MKEGANKMKEQVQAFIEARHLLKRGATVLVGVSGGPDSMALLHVLVSLREAWDLRLIVVALDHELRGTESAADITYVEHMCAQWHVPCVSEARDVAAYQAREQVSISVAARDVRYQFFAEQMAIHQADYLALGHHGDDQVETMAMRFVRSARSNALTGIPVTRPFAGGFIIRPLLAVTKAEILAYCTYYDIAPRLDPSNEDVSYTRNDYRKHVVPLMKERNHNIHQTMQQLSESLQADETYLQSEALKMYHTVLADQKEGKHVSFKINLFKSYPLSLQRRCYHLILKYLYPSIPENITYIHEEIFFKLLEGTDGNSQIDFPGGLIIERSYQLILFYFQDQLGSQAQTPAEITIPGDISLPDGARLQVTYTTDQQEQGKHHLICDLDELALPLHVRTRQPGDRMTWKGLAGSKKLKDIFIDQKIPRLKRDTWPIVTDDQGNILWLVGLRKSTQARSTAGVHFIQLVYEE